MPIFETRCPNNHIHEDIYIEAPTHIPCPVCDETSSLIVSNIALMKGHWGDCGLSGSAVTGYYDRGLGTTYHSYQERERIMKARGLQEFDENAFDRHQSSKHTHVTKEDAYLDAYSKAVDSGAEPLKAMQIATDVKEAAV